MNGRYIYSIHLYLTVIGWAQATHRWLGSEITSRQNVCIDIRWFQFQKKILNDNAENTSSLCLFDFES